MVTSVGRILLAGIIVACVIVTSCDTLPDLQQKRRYIVTLHYCSAREQPHVVDRKLIYGANQHIYVRNSHILSSLNLPRIEAYTVSGGHGVRFFLDNHGRYVWTQISGSEKGQLLALLVDGELVGFVRVTDYSDEGVIDFDGPFSTELTMGLVDNVERNYEKLN